METKITINIKENGTKIYTLWQDEKPLAQSSDYIKLTKYQLKK
jgi:hypothetical protein